MAGDGFNYFSFWDIFWQFIPPPLLKQPEKSKLKKKMKQTPGDIIILHNYTKNHDHMRYGA